MNLAFLNNQELPGLNIFPWIEVMPAPGTLIMTFHPLSNRSRALPRN
jgi:hypothetical protein